MTRFIDDRERRARLGRRQRLASESNASTPDEVARALTAIHGTDPASTILGILARAPKLDISTVELALYDEKTIVRVLGMRRTVFAVPFETAPVIWSSFDTSVARLQRRALLKALQESGIEQTDFWIAEAESRMLAFLDEHPGSTSTQTSSDDPYLGYRLPLNGPGAATSSQSVASRLLTLLSAEGRVIRARPKGGWTSTQFTWVVTDHWRGDWPERPSIDEGDAQIAESWLAGHGPATVDDLAWWTGWPKGRSRSALDRAGAVEVRTSEGTAFVLASDLDEVSSPEPWVALLPGLDSATMGWKRRDFYLGPHADSLFDNVGNAGPTVWVDGRIVGGWAQRDDGDVVFELYEDIGRDASLLLEERAAHLQAILANVRIKPRARRYTSSESRLLGR